MILTGRCKEDFERWYLKQGYCFESLNEFSKPEVLKCFYSLANPFKYGVYIDFFDSVHILIEISFYWGARFWKFDISKLNKLGETENILNSFLDSKKEHATRHEAQEEAILKAIEIFNN